LELLRDVARFTFPQGTGITSTGYEGASDEFTREGIPIEVWRTLRTLHLMQTVRHEASKVMADV
jgi:hypothetical protein